MPSKSNFPRILRQHTSTSFVLQLPLQQRLILKTNSDNLSHGRSGHSAEPFAVSTDVTQWRQDVNAFTAATRQMLDSIHQELSNGLAHGQTQVNVVPRKQTPNTALEQPSARPSLDNQIAEHRPSPQTDADRVAMESDQILARLKAQLAEQLDQ